MELVSAVLFSLFGLVLVVRSFQPQPQRLHVALERVYRRQRRG